MFHDGSLNPYFHQPQQVSYQLETLHGTSRECGEKVTIEVLGNGSSFFIEGLVRGVIIDKSKITTILVPEPWQQKYNLPEIWTVPQVMGVVVIGQDLAQIMPMEFERFQGLSLSKSILTGNLILSG